MKLWKVALISTPIAMAIIGLMALIGVGLGKKNKKTTTKPTDTTVTPTPVVEKYSVNVVNEISGITISGTGDYKENETVTLTASGIKPGDFFTWSINGSVVEVGNTLILTVEKSNINITIDLTRYDYLYYKTESNIYFGSYPQTLIKNEDIIKELNEKSGGFDENTWTDYEYYVNGEKESFMFYKDIDLNNDGFNDYRGIYFKQYRPDSTMVASTSSFQDNWGYNTNTIYWFSFDPIKWNIVTVEDNKALLWASLNLDSQDFYNFKTTDEIEHNGGTGYANNYELSEIRIWLNDNFYNSAFNDLQKTLIINTLVKNDIEQVYLGSDDIEAYRARHEKFQNYENIDRFVSSDTNDNVFILSLRELFDYFDTDNDANIAGSVLRANPTDYAKSQGALKDNSSRTVSLLRSFGNSADCANYIAEGGGLISGNNNTPYRRSVAHTQTCIRPALWIDLSGTDYKKVTVTSSNDEAGFISANGEFGVLNNYAMTLKAIPNNGYTFVGWFVGEEAVSTNPIYTFDVKTDIEIEAKWIVNQYMINVVNKSSYDFDYTHGGQYDYKSSVTLEFNQPEGYRAKLYNEKDELLELDNNTYTLTIPYYDLEYSVYFELITYKIIYDVPYGTVNHNPTTHTVEDDEITLEAPEAMSEYTFTGWYIDDELVEKIPGFVAKDIYVYGSFETHAYNVNIVNNTNGYEIIGGGLHAYSSLVKVAIKDNDGSKAMAIELETLDKDNKEVIRIFNREEYEFYMPNHNVTLTIMDIDIDNPNYYNGESPEENRNFAGDEILYFGTYPQAIVKDRDINARLVELAGKNPTETGATGWIDYGFYEQDEVKSYMWYKDITLGNDKYRAVYFTEYRPGHLDWKFSQAEADPDRTFNKDEIYFFKFEPIAWKKSVKEDSNLYAALLCLDAQSFVTNTNPSSTSYDGSYLRSFLLNTFYDTAFNSTEKSLLENSYSGDKVSIFKHENGIVGDYENVSDHLGGTKYLKSEVTDYALCLRPKSKGIGYDAEGRGTYYLSRESSSSSHVRVIHDNITNEFATSANKKTVLCIRPIIRLDVTNLYSVFMYVNDIDGGTVSGYGTYNEGDHVTFTATPKEGYAFIGWTDNRTGDTLSREATYEFNIDKNYSLTAVFLKKYYIKYEGIEDADNKGNPEYYTTNDTVVSLFQPTKEGYKFDKWTRNGEYFNFQFETSLKEDITIKANWIALDYDINYSYVDLDGNAISNVSNPNGLTYTYDSGNIDLQVATHENYELVEWRNENNEVVTFINNDSIDKTTEKITLIAVFKPNKYEVIVHNLTDGLEISNGGLFDYNSDVAISLLTDTDTFELFIEANFSDGVVKAVTKDYTFKMPGYTLDIYASKIEASNYVDDGKDVYYGSYPQTLVTDETINAELLILAGTAPTVENFNGWTDYGFYENGEQKSFAWYKDVVYNNEKYRGVYFTNYRPSAVNNTFSDMISDYDTNKIYFFKFEAIRWMCYGTTTVDGKSYNMYTTYFVLDEYHRDVIDKQYPYYQDGSALREFITGSFYDLLFSDSRTDILGDIFVNDNNKYDKVSIFREKADVQSYLGNTAYMKVPQSDYAACLRPINQASDLKNGAGGAYHLRTINVSWGYGNIIRDAASSTLEHSIDERIICGIRPIIYLSSDVYKVYTSINVESAGTVSDNMAYFANSEATVKATLNPESGYRFIGWKLNGAIVSNLETYTFTVSENVMLEAIFAKVYDITYHNVQEGITNPNRTTYTEYDEFNLTNLNALDGYEFKGFYTDPSFSEESKITKIDLGRTGNIDIYAKYDLITYGINYHLTDGETNNNDNPDSFTVISSNIELKDPTKPYYKFLGWYTDSSFSETSKIEVIASGTHHDIDIYPKFNPITYTITYHLSDDETNDSNNPSSFTVLDSNIELKDPSKGEYYNFLGWYTTLIFDEETKVETINTSTPTNYDLYPKFEKKSYEVKYFNNTGEDITISGYGLYKWGEEVTLEAIIGSGVETYNMIVKFIIDFDEENSRYGLTTTFTMPKDIVVVTVSYEQICEINNQNGYVIMGTYPKTKVTDTTLVGNLNANYNFDEETWIKYDYETGTMYYLDVDFADGYKYRGVYIVENRNQAQVDNGYPISDGIYHGMYWFKYEPIRWRILSNDTETEYYLISEDILDCGPYNSALTESKANYDSSTINDFLSNTFATMTFNGAEETIIEHDVSLFAHGSEDNPELDVFFNSIEDRIASPSDYAKCQGLTVNGDGNSAWWLATPDYSENDLAYQVNAYGGDYSVNVTSLLGVRPVIWIKLQ